MRAAGLALIVSACATAKYPPPAPPRAQNLGLAISTTTLANGLRVVLVRDPHAIDVQVTMRYHVGAADDLEHPGLAHFAEHLMFQQQLAGQPLFTHFEDTATAFNAFTTYDATTYVARAPAARLGTLLSLEATRLAQRCQTIGDDAFAREREVVINEIKERDQVTEVFSALHSMLYPDMHPYRQAIGGSVQTVGAITRAQACSFIDAHYAPSNAVLVVSGNLTDAQPLLDKLAADVPARRAAAASTVPAIKQHPVHVEIAAPVDEDILVLAWPLPTDPLRQAQVRAVASALPKLVDSEIKGSVVAIELGDRGAPMYGLAVVPGEDETFQDATQGARHGIEKLPAVFAESGRYDDVVFERIREGAVYGLYSSLEDGSERDTRLAAYVLAGRDPKEALASELSGLQHLSRTDCIALAETYLGVDQPTVVTLKATEGKKRGQAFALRKPIHDMGARRTPPDPALAQKPADGDAPRDLGTARKRRLANGLEVVMLPMSSVPTVDIRLVFRAGTADEAPQQRGIAMLTANALAWDLRYLNDLIAFAAAGGMKTTDVGNDRTSFTVQGVDSHLDVLLAGLRRWVRDGTFDDDSAKLVLAMRRAAKRSDDEGALTDSWRVALFGANHPYVEAGLVRHANSALTLDDAAAFRATHYTPSNATLVIAGNFDPVLADRWVDFLFADWHGATTVRPTAQGASQPASIAKVEDLAMVQLRIAMPASASHRAEQLVAAEMLSEIAHDVRFQLGAGYTVDAQLSEQRLARHYVIGGWIDAARSTAAIQFIRDRLQKLRTTPDAAARAFITARQHVLTQLLSQVSSADSLATRVEHDVEMERAPMSDVETAAAVRALTIDQMSTTLAELDLSHAAVLMRGPAPELERAFAALGRKPSYVKAASDSEDPTATAAAFAAPLGTTAPPVGISDVEPALTEQPPPRIAMQGTLSYGTASFRDGSDMPGCTGEISLGGPSGAVHVGYRYARNRVLGVRGSISALAGSCYNYNTMKQDAVEVLPMSLGPTWSLGFSRKWWVGVDLGLRVEHASATATRWALGLGYGIELGRELVQIGMHRFALAVGYEGMSMTTSPSGSTVLWLGLVYRH